MEKYEFRPEIVVDGDTFPEARNKLLKILAQAELDGRIYHFTLSSKQRDAKARQDVRT